MVSAGWRHPTHCKNCTSMAGWKVWRTFHNIEWQPHSPDPSPLDLFFRGSLKDRVYLPSPQDTSALKMSILREIRRITVDFCKNVIRNFRDRMRLVTEKQGGHLEHVQMSVTFWFDKIVGICSKYFCKISVHTWSITFILKL